MSKIKNDNYVQISGWMVTQLKLKGNELLIYAIIYGFCQDGSSSFKGSLSYFEEWLQVSKPTVIKTLQALIDKGLIQKIPHEKNGVNFNDYVIVNNDLPKTEIESVPPLQGSTFVLGKAKKSDSRVKDLFALAAAFTSVEEERKLLYKFIENSLQLKRTLTVESFKLQLKMLENLDCETFKRVIEDTIASGWINVKYALPKTAPTFDNTHTSSVPAKQEVLDLAGEQF